MRLFGTKPDQDKADRHSQAEWEAHAAKQAALAGGTGRLPPVAKHLPDTRMEPELAAFRDQCASGVRQAASMITAMEHQLAWERQRRAQAEEDCKVLLAAVDLERSAAGEQLTEMAGVVHDIQARRSGESLSLAAHDLPRANQAAIAIQRVFRGNKARRELEGGLIDILKGVDPELDPTLLPPGARARVEQAKAKRGGAKALPGSGLDGARRNVTAIERRLAAVPDSEHDLGDASEAMDSMRGILRDGYSGGSATVVATLAGGSATVVATLAKRCCELQYIGTYDSEEDVARAYDYAAVEMHGPEYTERNFPGELISERPVSLGDESKERKTSDYIGVSGHESTSAWRVQLRKPHMKHPQHIGTYDSEEDAARAYDHALVKLRGPEYTKRNFPNEAALIDATQQLESAQLSIDGMSQQNARVLELSQLRTELNEERETRGRLQHTIDKLRAIIAAQAMVADGGNSGEGASRYNPHVAAWYRKQLADHEFANFPPKKGVYLLDGPDAEVEVWDDLRASEPDSVLISKDDAQRYWDLVALQRDFESSAARDDADPLFTSGVPDTSFFNYSANTPLVPMRTPHAMLSEGKPEAGYTGHLPSGLQHLGQYYPHPPSFGGAPPGWGGPSFDNSVPGQAAHTLNYEALTPLAPMYSTLPMLQENAAMSAYPDSFSGFQPPRPGDLMALPTMHAPSLLNGGGGAMAAHWTPDFTPPGTPADFEYAQSTPTVDLELAGQKHSVRTVQPLVREAQGLPPLPHGPPPPLSNAQIAAALAGQGLGVVGRPPGAMAAHWTPNYTPPGTPGAFDYAKDTPTEGGGGGRTIRPLLRDGRQGEHAPGQQQAPEGAGAGAGTMATAWTPNFTPPASPPPEPFDFNKATPRVKVELGGHQIEARTNLQLIRDGGGRGGGAPDLPAAGQQASRSTGPPPLPPGPPPPLLWQQQQQQAAPLSSVAVAAAAPQQQGAGPAAAPTAAPSELNFDPKQQSQPQSQLQPQAQVQAQAPSCAGPYFLPALPPGVPPPQAVSPMRYPAS
ncbi:hypothetical protein FOA52_004107 [Chlamydomonas sp. UWO 241]|nr:hypothetical protein FOA52_004107 [Chlamydomonas sp. UWO 241]